MTPGVLTLAVNGASSTTSSSCRTTEIRDAMRYLFERLKVVVEPSGAVGVAALLSGSDRGRGRRVGVILSGGNIGADRFVEVLGERAASRARRPRSDEEGVAACEKRSSRPRSRSPKRPYVPVVATRRPRVRLGPGPGRRRRRARGPRARRTGARRDPQHRGLPVGRGKRPRETSCGWAPTSRHARASPGSTSCTPRPSGARSRHGPRSCAG